MDVYETLTADAQALAPQLVAWRRDFHAHPELGFQEVRTAGIVAAHLRDLGLEVSTGIGRTGVVAVVEPDGLPLTAPTLLLRFDMDALPIQEENDVPYRSRFAGIMHACGHDGHTAIGMGIAQLLASRRHSLPGRVKLIFQPAEEIGSGARAMIADGVLQNPTPSATFGLHLWTGLPLDQVVVQPGPLWADAASFHLVVYGRGGHGAVPHETIDATLVASQIVVALQSIVARNINPAQAAVVTVGSFHSGHAFNVIAEKAELQGTIRSFDPTVSSLLKERIAAIAAGVCAAYGATCDVAFPMEVPATVNSEEGATLMRRVARAIVDPGQVIQIAPMMVAEDVSEFLHRAPGCFILVGATDPAQPAYPPHHSPGFDFDERVLSTGVALVTGAALTWLAEEAAAKLPA
jgi:amidohydrolase